MNYHFKQHKDDTGFQTKEEYEKEAIKLITSPTGGDIQGFKTKSGFIVRYDRKRKLFVKGNFLEGRISTFFKPYYDTQTKKFYNDPDKYYSSQYQRRNID